MLNNLTLELPNAIFFPCNFFRNASVYLWATHFHIFWWINFKKMLLPGESVLKKVKCLGRGGYHPSRSQLLDKIGTKFQRLPPCFRGKESNGTIGNTVRRNRKSEIQDGGLQSGNTYIWTCKHDSNEIPTATPHVFWGKVSHGDIEYNVRRDRK